MGPLFVGMVTVLGFIVCGSIGYLLVLLAAAAGAKRRLVSTDAKSRPMSDGAASNLPRLVVVIPAHNEELVLAATLSSLAAQDYPHGRREVVVVADNCSDTTAAIAREHGATVMERMNRDERGKGYALAWAFDQLLRGPEPADAFVIVDADTWVAPDFLTLIAARLARQTDSRGYCALQGRYGVLNASDGWRAALMAGAFDLFNHIKPLGRERLGLGVGLKGNGMAFTRALLRDAAWQGSSVTEDIDYGLDLARHHGVRVGYAPEALVLAQMPTTAAQASSQRERWEGGRYQLVRQRALPLLAEGLRRRSLLLWDAGIDLLLPPLAELAALIVVWAVLVGIGAATGLLPGAAVWLGLAAAGAVGLACYILIGLRVSDAPRAAYAAMAHAPVYAVWKLCLYAARFVRKRASRTGGPQSDEWVRTERAPLAGAGQAAPGPASATTQPETSTE
jgi:1,2-diacylglycerol 3-beta-glucosyltransferase